MMRGTPLLSLYRAGTRLGAPLIARHLRKRAARGKEDAGRLAERFGRGAMPEDARRTVWIHAASVGEALSALPLIGAVRKAYPDTRMLMTTGTVTSAKLIAERAPDVVHRFAPVDTPHAVAGFLDQWRPDIALWMESELWPNMLQETAAREIPITLINARMSKTSARNWGFARGSAAALLNAFDLRLAQTEEIQQRLLALGADDVVVTGDLKAARGFDPVDDKALAGMRDVIGARPLWLAASTHPGDELAVLQAHEALALDAPDLLTIIAPRHPERGAEIEAMAAERTLGVTRRAVGGQPTGMIYVADTLGELPLWYSLAPIALIGGGWDKVGGHNPLEAAQRGVAVLSGDDVPAFVDTYARLTDAGAAKMLEKRGDLAPALRNLTEAGHPNIGARAMGLAGEKSGAPDPEPLDKTLAALSPLLARALA